MKKFAALDLRRRRDTCLLSLIFTGRNEVVAKVIFFTPVCHSVHREGVSASVHAGIPHPPRADTPWSRHPPPEQTPPGKQTPPEQIPPPRKQTPPPEADSGIWSISGRYASYWNAFLYLFIFGKIWLNDRWAPPLMGLASPLPTMI